MKTDLKPAAFNEHDLELGDLVRLRFSGMPGLICGFRGTPLEDTRYIVLMLTGKQGIQEYDRSNLIRLPPGSTLLITQE